MSRRGAIICGYQGVGKSSIAGRDGYIDLESGNFWVDGQRQDNWYVIYCEIAMDLARQGYRVMTASHKVVRDYFASHRKETDEYRLLTVSPSVSLKDKWIKRLRDRYESTGLVKDEKALLNAESMFEVNVKDLQTCEGFTPLVISVLDDGFELKEFLRSKILYLDITD